MWERSRRAHCAVPWPSAGNRAALKRTDPLEQLLTRTPVMTRESPLVGSGILPNMLLDPLAVAGLFGYSAAKDLVAEVTRRIKSRNRTAYQSAADTFAYDTARCSVVENFYRDSPRGDLLPYRLDFPGMGVSRETGILTRRTYLGCGPRQGKIRFAYIDRKVPDTPPKEIAKYAIEISARLQEDHVILENRPLYSLQSIDEPNDELIFQFGLSEFLRYRFCYGLLEDEIIDALVRTVGNVEAVCASPDRYLPVRRTILPTLLKIEDVGSRLCGGGVGVLFAMARDVGQDFLLLVQVRSGKVSDSRDHLAVVPKAFHQPFVDAAAEVHIRSSVYRETYEELYSGEEARTDRPVLSADWYFDRCPGVAYFRDHGHAFQNEVVAFGLSSLLGNFEFAVLLAIPDEWYWKTFRRQIELSLIETKKVIPVSSLDQDQMADILAHKNWAPESRFHFVECLIRLAELYPDRVRVPRIVRKLGDEVLGAAG